MIGIYGIFRKSDDKCVYVGQSIDVDRRIRHHLIGCSKIKLEKDLYYGKLLEEHDLDNKQYRLDREAYWINELNPELNVIINNRLSESQKENIRKKLTGHSCSKKTRQKIGAAHKGKIPWNKGLTKTTDERVAKCSKTISKSNKGKTSCNKGKKWINNGVINKMIKPDELHQYLSNGWVLGMVKPLR